MNVVSGHNSELKGYAGLGKPGGNEMNCMNHAPGADSIAQTVDQQSSALQLCSRRSVTLYITIYKTSQK